MLARRGIALIPDETELELKNTKERSGSLLLKPNTVVRVTKTADTPTQSGIARVTLTKDGSNHAQLRYAEVLRCHTLFLELPDTSCFVWLLHMLDYCYPFMKKLVLTSAVYISSSYVVHYPFFFMCVERLLRFNNFPSLAEVVVCSRGCVGDEQQVTSTPSSWRKWRSVATFPSSKTSLMTGRGPPCPRCA